MTGFGTARRLRRWWRLAGRELSGAARSAHEDPGRLERPGHARSRTAARWDGAGWRYRRLITPLVFTVLLLGAISGSYYAAAGGLLDGGTPGTGAPDLATPGSPSPVPSPSTSSAPAVTVLPATPVPGHPGGTPSRTPSRHPSTPATGTPRPPVPCVVCPTPSAGGSGSPTGSPGNSPSASPTPSVVPSS